MLNTRKELIIQLLAEHNYLSVNELASLLYVSVPTIRRDLILLEKEGRILRTHGGASYLKYLNTVPPLLSRDQMVVDEKRYIANLAKKYVEDGSHLFFELSSTGLYLARAILDKKNLTVLSNSISLTQILSSVSSNIVECTGGKYDPNSNGFFGDEAVELINNRSADFFFISADAIDENGLSSVFHHDLRIQKAFYKNAKKTIALMDNTKVDVRKYYHLLDLKDLDVLITNKKPNDKIIKACIDNDVELVY